MDKVKVKLRGKVRDLSSSTLDAMLVEEYTKQLLYWNTKFIKARNKFRKMEYRSMAVEFQTKLNVLNADTSVKLSN